MLTKKQTNLIKHCPVCRSSRLVKNDAGWVTCKKCHWKSNKESVDKNKITDFVNHRIVWSFE